MAIAIGKNKKISAALESVLREIDFVPGKKVFVKPNLSGRYPVLPGENTSVEVMDALLDFLRKCGSEVFIGHGAILGSFDHNTQFKDTLIWSGFDKYQNMSGVKIINLDEKPRTELKIDELTFHLPLDFINNEMDTYINLAKIKTHMETTVSFSLKNQMGLPSPADRVMMHKTNLERTIGELARYCKPHLSILEGFPAMENNGPHHGTPLNINLVIAGDNMVELDSFLCYLLGYNLEEIKHIKYAENLGAGKIFPYENLEKYKIFFVKDFKKAKKEYRFGRTIMVYPTYSCSRCINAVNEAGREFKKHPFKYWRIIIKSLFSRKKINIIFGKADELKLDNNVKNICIGQCAKNFADKNNFDCLEKCPPGVDETRDYLLKNIIN